jgi:hypothetical protein
LRTRYFSELR